MAVTSEVFSLWYVPPPGAFSLILEQRGAISHYDYFIEYYILNMRFEICRIVAIQGSGDHSAVVFKVYCPSVSSAHDPCWRHPCPGDDGEKGF